MYGTDETPNFYYNGHEVRILFISADLQYVSINDIRKIPDILPFITNCVDKAHVLNAQGEAWIENNVFAELLHAFHPTIQQEIIKQTLEVVLNALGTGDEVVEGYKRLKDALASLLLDTPEEDTKE